MTIEYIAVAIVGALVSAVIVAVAGLWRDHVLDNKRRIERINEHSIRTEERLAADPRDVRKAGYRTSEQDGGPPVDRYTMMYNAVTSTDSRVREMMESLATLATEMRGLNRRIESDSAHNDQRFERMEADLRRLDDRLRSYIDKSVDRGRRSESSW